MGGKIRILIADDLPRVCKALALELRGIATTTTADGGTDPYAVMLDAVERLTTDPPDLLLVDGLEGYGAALADIALSEGVPVLAYTTAPGPFRRLGVRVLEKPATREELVAAVRSMTTEVQDG
jgi:CheY-like chemotaxis protein